jgi:hypothetical protein
MLKKLLHRIDAMIGTNKLGKVVYQEKKCMSRNCKCGKTSTRGIKSNATEFKTKSMLLEDVSVFRRVSARRYFKK